MRNEQHIGVGIAVSMLLYPTAGLLSPAMGAQRIYASYSILENSISVDALETFAKTGELEGNLAYYARKLNQQQLERLRRILTTPIDLGPVEVSQFLYTPIGETLLRRLGNLVETRAGQSGFYALRAALILAAAEPEGLTLLNVLRKFPTPAIRINLNRSLDIVSELENLVEETKQAIALISQKSAAAAAPPPSVNFSRLPDLRQRGSFTWDKQTLELYNPRRDRYFLADIYLPNITAQVPVIVISHGLGANRQSFAYLAQQLASYGFAVAVPEHPGSDSKQLQALLSGRSDQVTEPSEFINRPLDVKYLLDALERLDVANPNIQLNLKEVGAIGQSFGGYTVLALAGASLNIEQRQKQCQSLEDSLNVSLLLQCRALQLPGTEYNLRDRRIEAVMAINPITSIIFGEEGINNIQIPIMLVSSSADKVAPALPEQIEPFTWLTSPEKYLVLLEGGTHFSVPNHTDSDGGVLPIPTSAIGPNPAIAHRYVNALSVAFFKTYITGKEQYRPYLTADYAQAISQDALSLSLVRSLSAEITQK